MIDGFIDAKPFGIILLRPPQMEKEPLVLPNKSCKTYFLLENGTKAYFSGDFDSGNLEKAEQLSQHTYRVTPGLDKTRNTTNKTFFHFKVQGFRQCTIKFIVGRVYLLEPLYKLDNLTSIYCPVVRRFPNAPFERVTQDVSIHYNSMDQPQLNFSFTFEQENWVEFAFIYPYSYEQCERLVQTLASKYKNHPDIYFHQQTLVRTSETRKVHLVTITDKRNIGKERMESVQGIFEEGQRPFKIDKPRIVISARVHPGETPASHCMEGVLRFLTNEKDYRSYLLRKHFQFCLIPMINPEGVFEGMFRNDLNGQNLNRLYLNCDARKHKSIWGITKWIESLDRLDFFFDLHAHPSRKGFFIYGNAFDDILEQVQAQIFSKMLEYNCPYFQDLDCIYSEKAMSAKDKFDTHTKEGCARVHYYKQFKMIHSFTVECGYFAPTKLNKYPPQRQFIKGSDYVCTEDWEKISTKQYTPESYMFMGKSLLISILDLFHVNPYSRISTSDFKSINSLRKFTGQRVYNEVQRFRLIDANCFKKIRNVGPLIEEQYYLPRFKSYGLTISENYGMRRRKKTFSLNSRLYIKKEDKQRLNSNNPLTTEQKDLNPVGSLDNSLEKQIRERAESHELKSIPSLPELKVHSSRTSQKKMTSSPTLANIEKEKALLYIMSRQNEELGQALHSRHPSEKKEEVPYIKRLQKQIISEIMKQKEKNKKQKRLFSGEEAIKIDKIENFLKRQNKSKFPLIHIDSLQK